MCMHAYLVFAYKKTKKTTENKTQNKKKKIATKTKLKRP